MVKFGLGVYNTLRIYKTLWNDETGGGISYSELEREEKNFLDIGTWFFELKISI